MAIVTVWKYVYCRKHIYAYSETHKYRGARNLNKYSPVVSARSDHEVGKCAARLGVTGATKWSVLWAVAEADAGGDPHVEEE